MKLGDLGFARKLSKSEKFAKTFLGTKGYMSPEILQGLDYNESADIWALGVTFYELIEFK